MEIISKPVYVINKKLKAMRRFTIPSLVLPLFLSLLLSSCSKETSNSIAPAPNLPTTPYNYGAHASSKMDVITFELGIVTIKPITITPPTNLGISLGHVIFHDNFVLNKACGSCHVGPPNAPGNMTPIASGNGSPNGNRLGNGIVRRHPDSGINQPEAIVKRMMATPYYGQLFKDAYGTTEITPERISDALAQYIAAMSTASSEELATDPRYTSPFK